MFPSPQILPVHFPVNPSPRWPQVTTDLFSVTAVETFFLLRVLSKWNHLVYILLSLDSLLAQHVFEVQMCYVYQ